MMIATKKLTDLSAIAPLKAAYLQTVTAPLDGYWKAAIVDPAPHWELRADGRLAGYFAAADGRLLQFYLLDSFARQADALFDAALAATGVKTAVVSTAEPAYLSLCLDRQTGVSVNSYWFHAANPAAAAPPALHAVRFQQATAADLPTLLPFYQTHTEFSDMEAMEANFGGLTAYVEELVANGQTFGLYDADGRLLGIGECRISADQPPYADVGMIVEKTARRRGVGTHILTQLKTYCIDRQLRPICSCVAENVASHKTVEKAGFIPRHRLLDVVLG